MMMTSRVLTTPDTAPIDKSRAPLDQAAIVDRFPGPAFIAAGDATVVHFNRDGAVLARRLSEPPLARLCQAIEQCAARGLPAAEPVQTGKGDTTRSYRAILLPGDTVPSSPGPYVLVLCHDLTYETNLTSALIDSRKRFKDLVDCSTDFTWETDGQGQFSYVSPKGAIGYSAIELLARPAGDLLSADHAAPEPLPFATRTPVDAAETWLSAKDGTAVCMIISALPVVDEAGVWAGARGVGRDVTEPRARDAALDRARARERLLGRIVSSIRDQVEADEMLAAAARETARAADAGLCRVWRRDGDDFAPAATYPEGTAVDADPFATAEAHLHQVGDPGSAPESPVRLDTHDGDLLFAWSQHHQQVNGAIALVRSAGQAPFSDQDHALLAGVADQLGIAMEQIARQKQLEYLSQIDPLTGLYNRRTFADLAGTALERRRQRNRCSALLYVDLDHFKQINDRYGHRRGDRILETLGAALRARLGEHDLGARLGGDEFVLWLGDADEAQAIAVAEYLLGACTDLRKLAGETKPPLSMSIGVAVDAASRKPLDELIEAADQAMYDAKKRGRATYGVARL